MKPIKSSLQMEDEIDLHQKGWIIQRIGWGIILLFLLAAMLGLFGTGWLSKNNVAHQGTSITFERFGRLEALTRLVVKAQGDENGIRITIPQHYLEMMEIEKIIPEPADQKISKGAVVYTFKSDDQGIIQFYFKPESTGTVKTQITVNASDFSISHFIYP